VKVATAVPEVQGIWWCWLPSQERGGEVLLFVFGVNQQPFEIFWFCWSQLSSEPSHTQDLGHPKPEPDSVVIHNGLKSSPFSLKET